MATAPTSHVAILPSPGMGHLIPLLQFAKKLITRHPFSATVIILSDGPLSAAQITFLSTLPAAVDYILLPAVDFSDLPDDAKIEVQISLTVARSLPAIRDAVKSLLDGGRRVVAFVADLFGTDAIEPVLELGIPPYIFFPPNATVLSLFLHLPELDETVDGEYRDLPEKLKIPGCIPIHGGDLLDPVQDRNNDAYKWLLHHCKRYKMAKGIIVNSFKELEPGPIELLQKQHPIVYPVGPLIQSGSKLEDHFQNWLNSQPTGSVLYVSFGSGDTLSHEQMIELAHGLELSEHKFLWVLRCPSSKSTHASYFQIQNSTNPLDYLPDGFVERTHRRGLVVPSWAPQVEILSHPSTGGFLTHCGWNSSLESLVNGVPMIVWPLYAEQRMNAVLLQEDVKVALRPTTLAAVGENGVGPMVGRVEIAEVIKCLMEGEEGKGIRNRLRDLKDAAARAGGDIGASGEFIDELVRKWTRSTCL